MSQPTIYIFRHGLTDWNQLRKFQGHTNIPLNATGREQAMALGRSLAPLQIQHILSSDLDRAVETAKIAMGQSQIPMTLDANLRECNLGDLEGLTNEEVVQRLGEAKLAEWYSFAPENLDFAFPGGESKRQHLHRVFAALEQFIVAHPNLQRIGVSTHGGSLRQFLQGSLNPPLSPLAIPNCALFEFQFATNTKSLTCIREIISTQN